MNMSCKAGRCEHFAYLRRRIYESLFKTDHPRVGLVNIGSEEEKGPDIVKEANEILKMSAVNYIGYLEGKDLFEGKADVVVTDGFTGNVILKLIEGTSKIYVYRNQKAFI